MGSRVRSARTAPDTQTGASSLMTFRNFTARDRARYSVLGAIRELVTGQPGFASEISQDAVRAAREHDPAFIQPGEQCISIPLDLLAQRATTQMGSTGQHL